MAIACPDRKVICTEGDGSAMYTLQALGRKRERVAILLILFLIMAHAILKGELANVGAKNLGRKALDMMELDRRN